MIISTKHICMQSFLQSLLALANVADLLTVKAIGIHAAAKSSQWTRQV